MPGPRFLLAEDESWVPCINKRFIYPTRGAAGAGCLRAGTVHPSYTRTTQHPVPQSHPLILVGGLFILYRVSWSLGWPPSEVTLFSWNSFLGPYPPHHTCIHWIQRVLCLQRSFYREVCSRTPLAASGFDFISWH